MLHAVPFVLAVYFNLAVTLVLVRQPCLSSSGLKAWIS